MTKNMSFANRAKVLCLVTMLLLAVASVSSADTIVNFQTPLGDFDVQLYDTATPITVANFLNYVNSGKFDNSFFNRSATGFVLQGGGFTFDGSLGEVESFGPIQNEFDSSRSNLRRTLAMAKVGEQYDPDTGLLIPGTGPDSATSEFFFNLADNSGTTPFGLDYQNSGFTVFAEVIGSGMDVVDALAAVQTFNFGPNTPFSDLPLRNFTQEQYNEYQNNPVGIPFGTDNLNMFTITVQKHPTGDFNGDYIVDSLDFDLWNANYPTASGATYGDADGDGDVDGVDFGIWQANYPNNSGAAAAAITTIPEPATLGLMLVSGLALLRGRRRFRPSL